MGARRNCVDFCGGAGVLQFFNFIEIDFISRRRWYSGHWRRQGDDSLLYIYHDNTTATAVAYTTSVLSARFVPIASPFTVKKKINKTDFMF